MLSLPKAAEPLLSRFSIALPGGHYPSHELARFCRRHRRRLTLVSSLHPRAHLCQAPPPRRKGQMGRRRVRGAKLPHPQDTVAKAKRRRRATVGWYGDNAAPISQPQYVISRTARPNPTSSLFRTFLLTPTQASR